MIEGWIFEENLEPFLNLLAWGFRAEVSADDWNAISLGVRGTDAETQRWFDYIFSSGEKKVHFAVAKDVGTAVIFVRVMEPATENNLKILFLACQTYRLVGRTGDRTRSLCRTPIILAFGVMVSGV